MAIKYNSNYIETMPFSDTCIQVNLSPGVEQTFTVPGIETTQYQAYFKYSDLSTIFVRLNSTPTLPSAGSVGTQPYNEFKPKKRYVKGGDVIHFISPDAVNFGVSFREIHG